tara:strand:- start:32729 stop:33868 length:1140 start_codon:yes stop_codon:yes gene_type:complete
MDLKLSSDQIFIRDSAQAFANAEFAPQAALWDKECIFPVDSLKKAAALGYAGIYVSEDYGGSNLGRIEATLVFEALATACASTSAYMSIQNMVAWIIDQYGNANQKKLWLTGLTSMNLFGSYCLTEPNAGSDAASLKTSARLDGGDYILNGTKAFISGGGASDIYLVMARTGKEGPGGISCFVVEKGAAGLSFGKQEKKLGWHSQPTCMVILEDCIIPKRNMIGSEGEGFRIAMAGLDGGRVNIAACSIGAASNSLEIAREHTLVREQFGRQISSFQALQFKLADMITELEAARLMTWSAAQKIDEKDTGANAFCAMAKRLATDSGYSIVNDALQLLGGYGYLQDHPIERHLRDLRVHQILEGTNEIMRLIIARDLLGK